MKICPTKKLTDISKVAEIESLQESWEQPNLGTAKLLPGLVGCVVCDETDQGTVLGIRSLELAVLRALASGSAPPRVLTAKRLEPALNAV